ncbi:MAG: glycosyltransferase family 39 protein [Anaerolineales bacterium]|nr:glycosyltransferase family 39 protein [Chloroflexota bacterium]MBL6981257.1 glycosyltransferase family 39 protein [Anaerolineales bacterium]
MENFALWMLLLPFVVAAVCWIWLFWARFKGYEKGLDEQEPPEEKPSSTAGDGSQIPWYTSIWGEKWLLTLAVLLILGALYLILFAPPRLGGEIPILPNQAGRPFFSLHWLRDYLHKNDNHVGLAISLAGSISSLLALGWAQLRKQRYAGEIALLIASLTLAGMGQWVLSFESLTMGALLYGLAILGFISWAVTARQRLKIDLETTLKWPSRTEWIVLAAIFALAAFGRFYTLPNVPYGVEGDESKWIYEVVAMMVDGNYDSSGEYHRDALPVSFYMQAPFQRLGDVGILSARVGVVLYSLLGTLAFYWLLRQIAPLPLAALGTFFLSISVMDISASRLANVESHVKLWPILALALLALALHKQRWEIFALSGMALALGLLTYDTVLPIFLVMFLLLLIELIRQRVDLKKSITNLAAFLLPPLLTIPLLVPYFSSRLSYYKIDEKGWDSEWWLTLWENLGEVVQSIFVATRFDFIYNRQGPFFNAALLPLLAFGLLIAISTLRRRLSLWLLLWAFLLWIPVPVLTASPFGRVYYPGVPAMYALMALGGFILIKEVGRLLGSNLRPLGWIVGIAILAWLPLYNFYLYFNAVGEPADRQIRREIGELALDAAENDAHLFMPYWPGADEPLSVEYQIAELYLRQELGAEEVYQTYTQIPIQDFLPHLAEQSQRWEHVDILLDQETSSQREQWDALQETLFRCYPGGSFREGHFFDRYRLDANVLTQPACIPVRLQLDYLDEENPTPELVWELSGGATTSLRVSCEQDREGVIWVEAEKFTWGPGWGADVAFVSGWDGEGYLVDSYGSQEAEYRTDFPAGENAYAWVRYYKRVIDESPGYLQLMDTALIFANTPEKNTNQWVWERVGPFEVSEGDQLWSITRPYDQASLGFMALFIDSVVFTTDADFSPTASEYRQVFYQKTYPLANPAQQGIVNFNLPSGRYFCRLGVESDQPLVDAYGQPDVWSDDIEIEIP